MDRAPALLGQRQHRRTAHAGQDPDGLVEPFLWQVHQHVFHVAAVEDRVEAEGELCRFTALRLVHFRVGDQHRLGIKDLLDFDQPVRDERAARRYDVEDRIGHPDRRGDLHGTLDGVYFGVYALFGEEPREDVGVGGRHALAAEEVGPFVIRRPGNGQREATAAEAEVHGLLRKGGDQFALAADVARVAEDGQRRQTAVQLARNGPHGVVAVEALVDRGEAAVDGSDAADAGVADAFDGADPQLEVGADGAFHQHGVVLSPERVGDLLHGEGVGGRAGADPQQVDAARQRRGDVHARGDLR